MPGEALNSLESTHEGIRVVTTKHPGELVSIHLWFDAGTVDETPELHGAAHLLEHMLFKGTPTLGVGEAAARIEHHGGDLNAYTTWDQTVLHATVVSAGWEETLRVLADMAWCSTLDADELAREKPVVIEEIHGYQDDPDSVLEDRLTAALFPDHPYGTPILGTEASVNGIDEEALRTFWRTHYTGDRCVLAVAGPVTHEAVMAVVQGFKPPRGGPRALPATPSPLEGRVEEVPVDFETPLLALAFRGPGDGHPDLPALEVLASALGDGRAASLPGALRYRDPVVVDVWASLYVRRGASTLEVGMVPLEDGSQPALERALRLLEDPTSLTADQVERAKTNLATERVYGLESVETVCHDLAWYTARHGSPGARQAWDDALAAVTVSEVREVMARLSPPVVQSMNTGPLVLAAPSPRPRPTVVRTPESWRDEGPIASVYLSWPGGQLCETPDTVGFAEAWSVAVTTGAGRYGNVGIGAELDRFGAGLRAVGGRNTFGLQLTAPAHGFEAALEILTAVLCEPHFGVEEWKRLQGEALMDLDTLPDRAGELLQRHVQKLAFPEHPWGRFATRAQIRRTSAAKLAAFHRTWLTQEAMVVGAAGPVDDAVLAAGLQRLMQGLQPERPEVPLTTAGEHPTGHFTRTGGHEQALVVAVVRTPPLTHRTTLALRLWVALWSAQSGRLFLNLREKRSLAYSLWARHAESPSTGMLTVGLATDPARVGEARAALLAELEHDRTTPPSQEELDRARNLVLGQLAASEQSAASRAGRLSLARTYGIPVDPREGHRALADLDASDLQAALSELPEFFTVTLRP